jgi:hypothetical protein
MPYRRIHVDHACPNLVPDRLLRVTEVRLEPLTGSESVDGIVRVEYEIMPSLPPRGRGSTVASWPVVWDWTASDDAGTEYFAAGGAYGLAREGDRTTGVLSLVPLPSPEARRLRVVLRPWFPWADAEETFRECAVEVDLTSNVPGDGA